MTEWTPEGANRKPKQRKWSPKDVKRERKGAERKPNGAKEVPKGSPRVTKTHPKIDIGRRSRKGSEKGARTISNGYPFREYFPLKKHTKIYAKIDDEKT